jgi:hypothetical protein
MPGVPIPSCAFPYPAPVCWDDGSFIGQENDPTTVAEMHSWGSGDLATDAKFTYYHQASTEIDEGFSINRSSWSIAGQVTMNEDKSSSYAVSNDPESHWGYEITPIFTYDLWHDHIFCNLGGPPKEYDGGYFTSPSHCCSGIGPGADVSAMDGLPQYRQHDTNLTMFSFWDRGCSGKSFYTKHTSTTDRYSFAASAFGFNVGATSSWGNGMEIDYTFNVPTAYPRACYYPTNTFYLWGGKWEHNPDDASTLYAYTWPGAPNGDLGPFPAYPPHACYGGICPT